MLVATHGAVVLAIKVAPVVLGGQVLGVDVVLGLGGLGSKTGFVEDTGGFFLFLGPDFGLVALGRSRGDEDCEDSGFHFGVGGFGERKSWG